MSAFARRVPALAILFVAGLFEIGWAIGPNTLMGFHAHPSLATAGSMLASLALLGFALKQPPLGTAYAV